MQDSFLSSGLSPRQRKVYVLRWNPEKSPFRPSDFENIFAQMKGIIPYDAKHPLDWSIYDWRSVEHRDLYVMMQVGNGLNGITWFGFLGGRPYQYELENGRVTRKRYVETTISFIHRIEKTRLLTADKLCAAIPEVDWQHGHSGELIATESAEKLGLFLVDELRKVDDNDDLKFQDFSQKKYVLSDILTFMCPALKKELLAIGRNKSEEITDINDLMVTIDDDDYLHWDNIKEHLSLDKLDGFML